MDDGKELNRGCPFPKPDHRISSYVVIYLIPCLLGREETSTDLQTISIKLILQVNKKPMLSFQTGFSEEQSPDS